MSGESQFAKNLRVSLWRKDIPPAGWTKHVSTWANTSEARADQLLRGDGDSPSLSEIERIAAGSEQSSDELVHGDLLEGVDVLKENLKSLLTTLPHGGRLEFAKAIGVDPTTVSRWATGKFPPRRAPNLVAIRNYFQLPSTVEIRSTPLFLELGPIGSIAKRQWLHERIDSLPGGELNQLYPALRKLIG